MGSELGTGRKGKNKERGRLTSTTDRNKETALQTHATKQNNREKKGERVPERDWAPLGKGKAREKEKERAGATSKKHNPLTHTHSFTNTTREGEEREEVEEEEQ